jgi:hypothetical protein
MSIFSKVGAKIGAAVKKVVNIGAAVAGDVATIGIHLVTGNVTALPGDLVKAGQHAVKAIVNNAKNMMNVGIFNNGGSAPALDVNGQLTSPKQNGSGLGIWNALNAHSANGTVMTPVAVAVAKQNPQGASTGAGSSGGSALPWAAAAAALLVI